MLCQDNGLGQTPLRHGLLVECRLSILKADQDRWFLCGCVKVCIHTCTISHVPRGAGRHMVHVAIGMPGSVAVQALSTQGCGSHLRTARLVTKAKHAAAKDAKVVQLLSFLQPQSVADHSRRDGIPKEDYSLTGAAGQEPRLLSTYSCEKAHSWVTARMWLQQ